MQGIRQRLFSIFSFEFLFAPLVLSAVYAVCLPSAFGAGLVQASAPKISYSIKNDVSRPLSTMKPVRPAINRQGEREIPILRRPPAVLKPTAPDQAVQDFFSPGYRLPPVSAPVTVQTFEGISSDNNSSILGGRILPPDTNGDIGLTHYVQWVNLLFSVYDRSGTRLYGPAAGNTLWTSFGGPCETDNDGDPIALYDRQADRWFMSQFAGAQTTGPFYQCIAVSQTNDPTGSWYRYAFIISNTKFNDYPKFGIWPDGYYMSVNQFDTSNNFAGIGVAAFERAKMLQGLPAQSVIFDLNSTAPNLFGMLPSHLNGPNAPPPGAANYYAALDDTNFGFASAALEIWGFHVDWTTTANSTFTRLVTLPAAAFNSNLCNYDTSCIPQPSPGVPVDALSDRLMNRLQYRNFGPYETLVVNHSVNTSVAGNLAGVRWYQLVNSGSGWSIAQQSTYSPDSDNRWMGSIAMDGMGNMALGYSVSSASTYPSIRYTGRLSSDTANALPQGENTIMAGSGSQTSATARWGDYSSMSVDPADDATFWYTQEYYSTTSSSGWQTRIASISICSNNHARITGPTYFSTLGAAYTAAAATDTISAQSVTFRENLDLGMNKAITLVGGYDCNYTVHPLKTTIIGSLTVSGSGGSVVVDSISIQ